MKIISNILGNFHKDASWTQALSGAHIDWLELDQWSAQKNRLVSTTRDGHEIAISLERNRHLTDGDILEWNEEENSAIMARIHLKEVLIVELAELKKHDTDRLIQTCVEVGHAMGNQHWPAVVKGTRIYIPLTVDQKVMDSVMRTHGFSDITWSFVPGEEIIPYLAPHETRRLFGGSESPEHTHTHGDHVHDDASSHTHVHPHS